MFAIGFVIELKGRENQCPGIKMCRNLEMKKEFVVIGQYLWRDVVAIASHMPALECQPQVMNLRL